MQHLERDDVRRLLWQIAGKDNWEAIEEVPYWTFMFDRMPERMRLAVDLKLQGYEIAEIAKIMGTTIDGAYKHIQKARDRICCSLTHTTSTDGAMFE
ncbi:MAG: sigma factor-like helix-turn-helix DNA-binding protein [Candidatus Nezhaarchaeales archaeon]